ncbi:MAG: hypothetical protein DRM98_02285 [Thermoplasmata archaeon]|nr:MAG: hypothetical protein DRM98_02285 [Thermoplasmata archaeon]
MVFCGKRKGGVKRNMNKKVLGVTVIGLILLSNLLVLPVVGITARVEGDKQVSNETEKSNTYSNSPPDTPKIDGCYDSYYGNGEKVDWGYVTIIYAYGISTTDPDDDDVKFIFNWGDGETTTTGFISSGGEYYVPHTYTKSGTYTITAKAEDIHGAESSWSEPFEITMIDYFDLDVDRVYTDPTSFKPNERVDLCADIKNTGTLPSDSSARVSFYEITGHGDEEKIGETIVDIIDAGETSTAVISGFKWWNDREEHTILVEVESLPGERTDVNNIGIEYFSAPRVRNMNIYSPVNWLNWFFSFLVNTLPLHTVNI